MVGEGQSETGRMMIKSTGQFQPKFICDRECPPSFNRKHSKNGSKQAADVAPGVSFASRIDQIVSD